MAEEDEAELAEFISFDMLEQDPFRSSEQRSNVGEQLLRFQYIHQDKSTTGTEPASETMSTNPPTRKTSRSSSSEFQFVNISEPGEMKDLKNKKLVRRSVAFSHRRKQILRHSSDDGSSSSPHSCLDPNLNLHPPVNYCQVCGFSLRKKRTERITKLDSTEEECDERECLETGILGAGRVDPFGTFPIASKPYMHLLVDHYLVKYCPTLLPFGKWEGMTSPIVTRFFRMAIQNPVYFHATLCIAATHLNISSGQKTFKAIACHHRGESIRLLNEMLQEQAREVTDVAIAAVGSLAHHDILQGDTKALENHRKGILAMIKIRGGLQKCGVDSLIKYRALWIDMLSATYTHTKPILPVDELFLLGDQPQSNNQTLQATGFKCLLEPSNGFLPILQSLQELVSLTSDIRELRGILPAHDQLFSFTARRSWIEWSLSMLDNPGIENCIRMASMIYINIVLRKMPCASAVLAHLTKELKLGLEGTDLRSNWEEKTSLLLWVLFQGGAAATEEEMKKWYLVQLVRLCNLLELQGWNEVFEILNSFVWARCDLVKRCKPLWCEIAVGLSSFYGND